MIRSFHYASRAATKDTGGDLAADEAANVEHLASAWYFWVSVAFLAAYRRAAGDAVFVPKSAHEFERLLDACLLEKAVYELAYELNNRPDWVSLPLAALADLLRPAPTSR